MPKPTLFTRLIRVALCPLPLAASWLSLRIATAWYPTIAAQNAAYASASLSVGLLGLCLYALFAPASKITRRMTPIAFLVVSVVGLSPALSRALLPWEEPGTGHGSPLAVLIGIVFLAALGFVFVTIPMMLVAIHARSSRLPKSERQSGRFSCTRVR